MSEIKAVWVVWCALILCTVVDIVAGSLLAVPTGILWIGVSWRLLKEYFDDDDDDYPDYLGV